MPHLLSEGFPEGFKIRFEKPYVAAHHAEMWNLLSFGPKVNGLDAHAQVHCGIPYSERKFCVDASQAQCASARGSDLGEVLCIHVYL